MPDALPASRLACGPGGTVPYRLGAACLLHGLIADRTPSFPKDRFLSALPSSSLSRAGPSVFADQPEVLADRPGPRAPDSPGLDAPAAQEPDDERHRPWRPAVGLRIAIVGCFVLGAVASLYLARSVMLPVLIAMLLALLLSPAVGLLERLRLPRPLAALVVLLAVLSALSGLAMNLYAPAQQWLNAGPHEVAELRRKLQLIAKPFAAFRGATDRVAQIASPEPGGRTVREVVIERRSLSGLIDNTQAALVSATTAAILLYFLLASGDLFLRKLIRVIPNLSDKIRAVEISRTIQAQIGRYFGAITTINVLLGVVVGSVVGWLGLPTPALIGTMVAIFNFIPYLGPLFSLALITVVSALAFDTVGQILAAPLAFSAITLVEGQVIQPVVLGRHLSTTPVVMFLWVVFWGWLWGVGGVVVAVPLLVVVKICAEHIPSWAAVAEFLGRD